jgi:hypothetical protein
MNFVSLESQHPSDYNLRIQNTKLIIIASTSLLIQAENTRQAKLRGQRKLNMLLQDAQLKQESLRQRHGEGNMEPGKVQDREVTPL